jgi:hypothetical protein
MFQAFDPIPSSHLAVSFSLLPSQAEEARNAVKCARAKVVDKTGRRESHVHFTTDDAMFDILYFNNRSCQHSQHCK